MLYPTLTVNSDTKSIKPHEIRDSGSDRLIFHKAKKLIIPDNMVLLPFPAYCPELNPVERLWQYIKSRIDFALIKTMEDLMNVADILRKECTEPVVASITGYSYIVDAVVALMHS